MKYFPTLTVFLAVLFLLPFTQYAQPDFSTLTTIEGIRCYMDAHTVGIAYYTPGKLSIAVDREGMPDFSFIQTRYTGSYLYGDQGTRQFKSIMRLRVIMERPDPDLLAKIQATLWPNNPRAEMRPLPVSSIETLVGFTSLDAPDETADTTYLQGGSFTAEGDEGKAQRGAYWKEREFSLRLDNKSSQLLSDGLVNEQTIMSFSYAFYSKGVVTSSTDITSGTGGLSDELLKKLTGLKDTTDADQFCVLADAFSVAIDINQWPGLIKQLDINEEVPPGYPALEVRCYDFSDNLRPDLYAKTVEFKAQGVGRGEVITKVRFDRKNPDLTMFNIRFRYGVKIDKSLFYRTIEVTESELPETSDWKLVESWNSVIDVTSPYQNNTLEEPTNNDGY